MMRRFTPKLATFALLAVVTATLPACSKKAPPLASLDSGNALTAGGDETIARVETPDGGSVVNTITASATVVAVDPAARKVTLRLADGSKTTVTCGPEVANFGQVARNDKVNVTMTEELAIYLARGDADPDGRSAGVAVADAGAKPGGAISGTVQVTAKVAAIDAGTRRVTLALPDGSTEQVRAGGQIDLSAVKPGDDVTVRHTQAVAISVERP
jgi:hypothetical protein